MDKTSKAPSYEKLTNTGRKTLPDDQKFPAIFDRNVELSPTGQPLFKNGHQLPQRADVGRPKKVRLRDQLQLAWERSADGAGALKIAAYAVGVDIVDIPDDAKVSMMALTAWVFSMRGLQGSVEHFREIGDRVDPKPKRLEIEGVNGARRGGVGSNPDEVAAADDYYATISGRAVAAEVIDAEFSSSDDEDMSFLD